MRRLILKNHYHRHLHPRFLLQILPHRPLLHLHFHRSLILDALAVLFVAVIFLF